MTSVQERHASFYLSYGQAQVEDWACLDIEWGQIQRAWEWVYGLSANAQLLAGYLKLFLPVQAQRNRWREILTWGEQALPFVFQNKDRQSELVILTNSCQAYYHLGDSRRALELQRMGLKVA
jgi:hypothetical protein